MAKSFVSVGLLHVSLLFGPACCQAFADTTHDVRVTLFNGENLDGWHLIGCEAAVEDGLLVLRDGNGIVRTDHQYADFVLELQWRARGTDEWDSGIFFRCPLPPEGRPWPERYQINLKKGREGTLERVAGAECKALAQPGEWNHLRLTVIGNSARLQINGQTAWEVNQIAVPAGYLALQCEVPRGGQFEFKEIQVTELGYRWMFNGRDLSGWEGAGADASVCWKVEDGVLLCTGDKGTWLRSQQQHHDFNLRLEYKLKQGGNSGVYARVPRDGAHHGYGAGVEVQILDDQASRYRQLKPYQYAASVYAIAPSQRHVARPPGQWNALEIDCRGPNYTVTHNGHRVVHATVQQFPELQQRRLIGYLGLQNHSEQVWFRNIRIGSSMSE